MDKKQLILLLVFLFCIVSATRGQANRHNANWCFGHGAGIKFHGADSTSLFRSKAYSNEIAASVSDSNGQLQYYIGTEDKYKNFHSDLFNTGNQLLAGGGRGFDYWHLLRGGIIFTCEKFNVYISLF
jgi:hypothetical protein